MTPQDFRNIIQRFKQGVALLDKKVPNWRVVLRKHRDTFNYSDGDYCVLGTLEHHSGRLRVLAKRAGATQADRYSKATDALGISGLSCNYGFCWQPAAKNTAGAPVQIHRSPAELDEETALLKALWQGEFER